MTDDKPVLFAAELTDCGSPSKEGLADRRINRRASRSIKTRYREVSFENCCSQAEWMPTLLRHRVGTTMTWVRRLPRFVPLEQIVLERVR